MSTEIKGVQELISYFDKIGNKKVPKKALKLAGNHVKTVEKQVVIQTHSKYSRKNAQSGANYIKCFAPIIKNTKGYIDIGLKGKSTAGDKWNNMKGIYFNHYGFYHNGYSSKGTAKNRQKTGKKGKYIAGSRWMDTAYDKSSKRAYELLEKGLLEGLDL